MNYRHAITLIGFLFIHGMTHAQTRPAQLQWPAVSAQTHPWTRWWWMGSAVDTADLRINMEKYKTAGLGGLELTPVYGVKGYEDRFISYLSPHWMDMLSFTLEEARKLGLGLDMSGATGWPFGGGPLIDSVYACKEMFHRSWTLKAGEHFRDTIRFFQQGYVHTDGLLRPKIGQLVEPVFDNPDLQALALFQVRFPRNLPPVTLMAFCRDGRVMDLTSRVDPAGVLDWTAPGNDGAKISTAAAPAAGNEDWTLIAVFLGWHGKMVERAAPGAEGNVIDHFSAVALHKYLSRFDTAFSNHALAGRPPLTGLRAFFNDSYEVDDARGQSNWTPGFFDLFSRYRGYDLREHLPALFGIDSTANDGRVLCDYRETISDLLLDQFTKPWGAWAHARGSIIRDQAHGSPANILDLYAASDIPETEGSEILRFKFATSAAHVTGKKLASSESVTWLNEHFLSSLADIKKALDEYLLGGVNHIFYHGTAYSPVSDPWPGWLFYAAVHFTPNDPSWPNFHVLNEYVTRCQSFLQQGDPDNDVLLYYPIYDSWSERGHDLLKHYDAMEPEFKGTGFEKCADFMQTNGYAFDYISDRQLQQTSLRSQRVTSAIVTSGGVAYQAILIPGCRYISGETLHHLVGLAQRGATILVYDHLPTDPPGFYDLKNRMAAFLQDLGLLHFATPGNQGSDQAIQVAAVGKGYFIMGDDPGKLLSFAKIRREAMVGDSLHFVRRRLDETGRRVYFIVNQGGRIWKGFVPLSVSFGGAAIFSPMDGHKGMARPGHEVLTAQVGVQPVYEVYLQLMPGGSCLVETFPTGSPEAAPAQALFPYYEPAGEPQAIKGTWTLDFINGGPSIPSGTQLKTLVPWTMLPDSSYRNFSGMGRYTIRFRKPVSGSTVGDRGAAGGSSAGSQPRMWMLDLGKVDVTAKVRLNGIDLATLIGPDFRTLIPASKLQEENKLEIIVSNLMVNRIEYMDRQGIIWKKFYNYNFPPHVREDRGPDGLFSTSKWSPLSSGLSGPVTLTSMRRVADMR